MSVSPPAPATPPTLVHALDDARLAPVGVSLPLVSITVTSYNYAPYIVDCLRSIANQTYPHWECFVVDDCSTDDSPRIIEEFLASSELGGRFRFIRHETNSGQMEGFRTGLALSRGAFVVQVDADDVLLEDFLEMHVRTHLGRRPVAFTSSNQYQIDGQGQVVSGEHLDHQSKGVFRTVPSLPFHKGFWVWATSSSMMFRRDILRLILDGQPKTFRICADYYIAHFANLIGSSLLIPTIHGCYRRHGENNFGSNPVLGALNSVGCMSKHPPHDDFRQAMMDHLLAQKHRMLPILGRWEFMYLFFRLGSLSQVMQAAKGHPELFALHGWRLAKQYLDYRIRTHRLPRLPWPQKLLRLDNPF